MKTNPQRSAGRARLMRLLGVLSILSSLALGVGVTAVSAAPAASPLLFDKETGKNTYDTETSLSAQCPEGIAGTPGSDPAAKEIVSGDFSPGGTVHYVYHDNPNFASQNFNLEDCVVSYPAGTFQPSDFTAGGMLINPLAKSDLTKGATELDKATLSGIVQSTGDIFYKWTAPNTVTPGEWICNFARDTATGHGGGGNRKVSPTCYQVMGPIVPAAATLNTSALCDVLDSYTIPTSPNVTYKVNGVDKAAGTYTLGAGQTVTITAHTASPYFFAAGTTTSWGPWTGDTPPACPTPVTPNPVAAPTHQCGVADTYEIPSSTDVVYFINGSTTPTAAGIYTLNPGDTVTITWDAINGRTKDPAAPAQWGPFTGQAITPCPITPATPTHNVTTACGALDTYTIPAMTGVQYKVNGTDKAAGTYDLAAGATITITAVPIAPYTFTPGATTSWGPSTGSVVETCNQGGGGGGGSTPPPPTTQDANPANPRVSRECGEVDEYVIPDREGVVYRVDGDVVDAGRYELEEGETVEITAEAAPGYTIPADEDTSWTFTGQAMEECPTEPVVEEPAEPEPAVVEAPPAVTPAPAPVLAFTGLETGTMLMAALTLLGVGIALVVASKRELRVK